MNQFCWLQYGKSLLVLTSIHTLDYRLNHFTVLVNAADKTWGGIHKVKVIDVGLDLGADLGLFLLKFLQTVDNWVSQNLVREKSSLIT